jgi:ABC-type uncharacterized transport system substrate-binding protein
VRFILAAFCCILLLTPRPAEAGKPFVTVVNSYHAGYLWVEGHNDALRDRLAETARLAFFYLDTKRTPPETHQAAAEQVWRKILSDPPDVLVLADDNAVKLLGRRAMDKGIPLVFLGVNQNPREYLGGLEAATGVLERPLYKRSLMFLREILGPSLKRSLLLFDSGQTARVILDSVFKDRTSLHVGDTMADVKLLCTFTQWRDAVLRSKERGYDIILMGLYHNLTDDDGNYVPSEEVMAWTSAHTPLPIFGYWDFAVGRGKAVGGLVNSARPQGEAAADLVLQILAGAKPSSLYPVTPTAGQFIFSRHELRRWGIKLPESLMETDTPILLVD